MNLKQIREECWDVAREVSKVDTDRLWSTKEMNRYINRVYRNIARETKCIRDSETLSLCMIQCDPVPYTSYTPGTIDYIWANNPESWIYQRDLCAYKYPLNPVIIDIEEVKWTTRQWRLTKVSVKKWQTNPWWEQVVGMPTEYATDLTNNTLVLNFRSEISDTLRLVVRRLPLVDLVADTDTPEFRESYHDYFINGVLAQMYSKQDTEIIDLKKASDFTTAFAKDIDEIKQQEVILDQRLHPNNSMDGFR